MRKGRSARAVMSIPPKKIRPEATASSFRIAMLSMSRLLLSSPTRPRLPPDSRVMLRSSMRTSLSTSCWNQRRRRRERFRVRCSSSSSSMTENLRHLRNNATQNRSSRPSCRHSLELGSLRFRELKSEGHPQSPTGSPAHRLTGDGLLCPSRAPCSHGYPKERRYFENMYLHDVNIS